jgi:hypothetical protein
MSDENKTKKTGCLSVIGILILISIIVSIFKGGGYDVIKEENGTVIAESEINFDEYSLTAYEIAEIVWNISKKYKDADRIELTFTLDGYDFYGKKKSDKLNPYILTRDDIVEANKYELDNYKFQIGDQLASAYLMQNGYWPKSN